MVKKRFFTSSSKFIKPTIHPDVNQDFRPSKRRKEKIHFHMVFFLLIFNATGQKEEYPVFI
ncbi:MAG: hypothetical protein BM485_16610 [Desulfobulbaceae bacterium DB1]|nr:MAG: hypothetical protein BM485_16610 [Desulfobulbaceae bacterium DB1]